MTTTATTARERMLLAFEEAERQRLAVHVQAISLKTEPRNLLANLERWHTHNARSLVGTIA